MQIKRLPAITLLLLLCCTPLRLNATAKNSPVVVKETSESVAIGNDFIEREFSLASGKLSTTKIVNKRTEKAPTEFIPTAGSEEFIIRIIPAVTGGNTDVIKASDLKLKDIETNSTDGGKEVVFTFAPYTVNSVPFTVKQVVTMKDGDHFMRKHLEIAVPEDKRDIVKFDYIDCESMVVNSSDAKWSHPSMDGGVGGMSGYLMANGQPVYIQGMFFGSEFPVTDNAITDNTASIRYFSGKSPEMLGKENRLDENGFFKTWPTVAGAARSTDMDVIRTDFYEYINSIATPTRMRTQYNSWYDWMLNIDENNIMSSFKEMERGLSQNGSAPMDAYVVDDGWNAYGDWKASNTTGFWQFNNKFPNGLTLPKTLAHKYSSTFGLWLGPRGGYNWPIEFARFLESNGNGEHNPASDDICTNHKVYLEKLQGFFIDCQKKYDISYWKLDGFATAACPRVNDNHITGGENGMYWMTEHWERWIKIFEKLRAERSAAGEEDLWINLTCYVNPSPWFLQWGNSLWMQNSQDIGRADAGLTRQVDQLLSYRDGRYNDFTRARQFQLPYANIYNHDPIYGKTGSGLPGTMDDDEFRAYLFMIATRGAALWNLYFSYNMIDEGDKWRVTADALDWKRNNYETLRHAKMFGGNPETGDVYGYSAWNGNDGIISIRNPKNEVQSYTLKLDRNIGVTEGVSGLNRVSVLSFRTPDTAKDDNSRLFNYAEEITVTLQPGEARIWQFSKEKDTVPASVRFVKADSDTQISVSFDEHIDISDAELKIGGTSVATTPVLRGDRKTISVTVPNMEAGKMYTLNVDKIRDYSGNITGQTFNYVYFPDSKIAEATRAEDFKGKGIKTARDTAYQADMVKIDKRAVKVKAGNTVSGTGDFGIALILNTTDAGTLLSQGNQYSISVNPDGKIVFDVKGVKAVSDKSVDDGSTHHVYACRELNGMLKIYIDGEIDKSVYDETRMNEKIAPEELSVGSSSTVAGIGGIYLFDKAHPYNIVYDMATGRTVK